MSALLMTSDTPFRIVASRAATLIDPTLFGAGFCCGTVNASAGVAARVAETPNAPAGSSRDKAFRVRFMSVFLLKLNAAEFHKVVTEVKLLFVTFFFRTTVDWLTAVLSAKPTWRVDRYLQPKASSRSGARILLAPTKIFYCKCLKIYARWNCYMRAAITYRSDKNADEMSALSREPGPVGQCGFAGSNVPCKSSRSFFAQAA